MLPSDFKHGHRQADLTKESNFNLIGKIRVKVLVVLAIFTATLIFVQLVFANNLATDGHKLSNVNDEIKRLDRENTAIKAQIAQTSSLTNLRKTAEELGFEKPTKVIIP